MSTGTNPQRNRFRDEPLRRLVTHLLQNPDAAHTEYHARTELLEGLQCAINIRDFGPVPVDEPAALGGADSAPSPAELILGALGTCQEVMYATYAALLDIPLEAVSVEVHGTLNLQGLFALDESVHPGYEHIRFETAIRSPADPESIRQLSRLVEAHCPVVDTLVRGVSVAGQVYLNGDLAVEG
ncbi:OsmC family protein [Thiohalorhabdus sp. Cl-TMA]|uniref:OsmC family protein n=1 Tax=Thiohalorhabdus methylotrophus TaxID=3242694 RepID=A0ABV4TYX7_9GAMM